MWCREEHSTSWRINNEHVKDVPETSRFLLEMICTNLSNSDIETQKFWTLISIKATLAAQDLVELTTRGARAKQIRNQINAKIPSRKKLVGLAAIEQQIRKDSMHPTLEQGEAPQEADHTQTSLELEFICKHPYPLPLAVMTLQKSNKRLRKPDWTYQQHGANCIGGYPLNLLLAFWTESFPDDLRPKGLGTYHQGAQPGHPAISFLTKWRELNIPRPEHLWWERQMAYTMCGLAHSGSR